MVCVKQMMHYSMIDGQYNIKKFSDKAYRRVGQGNFDFSKKGMKF